MEKQASLEPDPVRLQAAAGAAEEPLIDDLGRPDLEEFNDRIQSNNDERKDIQKKTFTKWINSHLSKRDRVEVRDLFVDFCSGKSLLALLEILSGHALHPEKGRMKVHHLNNVNKAVQYLVDKCQIKLVNISSNDVVDGNPKLILGLVWSIILHWQIGPAMSAQKSKRHGATPLPATNVSTQSAESRLLEWCKESTASYAKSAVNNFTTSWSDGFAFNALIHRYHPELFNYDEIIAVNDAEYALAHAFQVAHDYLNVTKLLEPEDMVRPDKKSVIIYLTCLYEKLTTPLTPSSPAPAVGSPLTLGSALPMSAKTGELPTSPEIPSKVARLASSPSNPLESPTCPESLSDQTTITTASRLSSLTDLPTFNSSLQTTLAWLHEAKDAFYKMAPVASEVEAVKSQFHDHEKYMLELTRYQTNVGTQLGRGNTLLLAADLTSEQEKRVRSAVADLNGEWEELRVGAMERQASLQKSLMDLQQQQLDELSEWLTETEAKIKEFEKDIQSMQSLDHVKKCVARHAALQQDVEKQQNMVNSLQNMVVVVEDINNDQAATRTAYLSMEQSLEELGARWSAICKWVDDQWLHLHDVDSKWQNFHSLSERFSDWLDRNEAMVEDAQHADLNDAQLLVKHIQKLKSIESDMDDEMKNYEELTQLSESLQSYLSGYPQTLCKIQQTLGRLKQRWDNLVNSIEAASTQIGSSQIEVKEFLSAASQQEETADLNNLITEELVALREILHSYKSWINDELSAEIPSDALEIDKRTEQCRARVKSMRHQDDRVAALSFQRETLPSESVLHRDVGELCESWNKTLGSIERRGMELSACLLSAPPKKYLEVTESLLSWLAQVEELLADGVAVSHLASMEKTVLLYKDLQSAIGEHDVDYINKTGQDLISKSTEEQKSRVVRNHLDSLNKRWQAVLDDIRNKLDQLERNIHQLAQLEKQVSILTQWMSEMEEFQAAEQPAVGDTETLEAQLAQSDGALDDIVTLEGVVSEINESGAKLLEISESDFASNLKTELDKMNERWESINSISQQQNSRMKEALAKSKSLLETINLLSEALVTMETQIRGVSGGSTNPSELEVTLRQLKDTKEQLNLHQTKMNEISSLNEELMARSKRDSLPRLVNKIKQLESRLASFYDRLNQQEQQVMEMKEKWNRLLKLSQEETQWLEEMNERLNTDANEELDAEDMAAETDALELLLEEHQSRRDEMQLLIGWFEERQLWLELIQTQIALPGERDEVKLAQERVSVLERSAQHYQDTEVKISDLEDWMTEVNGLFREWNDQDLLAGDRPDDYKLMKEEFSDKDDFLASLELQVSDMKKLNKHQAADRLEKKLAMLRDDYALVLQNFAKWQRPVDFDPKLRRAQQQLKEIDDKIYFVEIYSDEVEHIEDRLENCVKFYTVMSEIKHDVEYVIKTGRLLVEKKQVDFPKRVNQTLDAVKSLYNKLGSRITQAKLDLEVALKIAQRLAILEDKLTKFLDEVDVDMEEDQRDDEWMDKMEKRFEAEHSTLPSLTSLLSTLRPLCEDSALDEASARHEVLKLRWQSAVTRQAQRRRHSMAEKSNTAIDLEIFKIKSDQLISHLNSLLSNPPHPQKLESELTALKSDVTTVRESGRLLLSSASSPDTQTDVQSKLGQLNEIYERMQSEPYEQQPKIPDITVEPSTESSLDESLSNLRKALSGTHQNQYEVARLIAECEVQTGSMESEEREHFLRIQADWKSRRDSTIDKWYGYQVQWKRVETFLQELEERLKMADGSGELLAEIEAEIARRQADMNNLNEQAEELTERETPSIESGLLELNQRWVGVRSKLSNLRSAKPGDPQNNNESKAKPISPPSKQKYEYAVVNKNRKNKGALYPTATEELIEPTVQANIESLNSANSPIVTVTSPNGDEGDAMDVDYETPPTVPVKLLDGGGDDDDVRTLISRIRIIHQQLQNSGLQTEQFSHNIFSTYTDILDSVSTSMETIEPEVTRFEGQRPGDQSLLGQVTKAWNELTDLYRNLHSNFTDILNLWNEFNSLVKQTYSWVEKARKQLRKTKNREGGIQPESAKLIQKDLEDGVMEYQSILHKLARTAVPLASKLDAYGSQRVTDKVASLTTSWHELATEIRARKPRTETIKEASNCLEAIEDLIFWLQETDVLNSSSVNYMDRENITDAYNKTQERLTELPIRGNQLELVSKSAKQLWNLPKLEPESKQKIGKDLQQIDLKWRKVTFGLRERSRQLLDSLGRLDQLEANCRDLNEAIMAALRDLHEKLTQEQLQQLHSDWTIGDKPITAELVGIQYRKLLILYKKHEAILPVGLEASYRQLTMRWTTIRDKSLSMRCQSDSSIEETLATGGVVPAAGIDDIYTSPRASVSLDSDGEMSLPLSGMDQSNGMDGEPGPPPPPRVESLQPLQLHSPLTTPRSPMSPATPRFGLNRPAASPTSVPVGSPSPSRDLALMLLREHLLRLDQTLLGPKVDLMNRDQIAAAAGKVQKLTGAVQDILTRLSMFAVSDADQQEVSGLKTECAECQVRSIARGKELRQLLKSSQLLSDRMSEFTVWLNEVEHRINSSNRNEPQLNHSHLHDTIELLNKQIQQHSDLEQEVISWKDNYQLLNTMTSDLLTSYKDEDTSVLQAQISNLAARWNDVNSFVDQRKGTLSERQLILSDLDRALARFADWLGESERTLQELDEEMLVQDNMRSSTWHRRCQDLQTEIDNHSSTHSLLSSVGKEALTSSPSSESTATSPTELRGRLDAMNQRWSALKTKTVQIRCRLDSNMDQWSSVISRCQKLIDELTSRENELIASHPVGSNLETVRKQIATHQRWSSDLERRSADVQQALAAGKFYLEREGADRRLSSASADSRVMEDLSIDSSDVKTAIKNIRRHVRLLNSKWLDLHTRSDKWTNQLNDCQKSLETIGSLMNSCTRHLNEIEKDKIEWFEVSEYPIAALPVQLSAARSLRHKCEQVSENVVRLQGVVMKHDRVEGKLDATLEQEVKSLTNRMRSIGAAVDDRVTKLISVNRSLAPDTEELLKDSVSRPFERSTTPAGVPYFINHETKTTQWDHPRYMSIMSSLPKFNTTKFSAYRTAQKLRFLQKSLGLHLVRLKDVVKICEQQRVTSLPPDRPLGVPQILVCLRDVFEHLADDRHASGVNVPLSMDLTLNWLLNLYDLGRSGRLQSLSFLVGIVIMCRGAIEDKCNYLLSSLTSQTSAGRLDEPRLRSLISNILQIPRLLGEATAFGPAHLEATVTSCLQPITATQHKGDKSPMIPKRAFIDNRQFLDWLCMEPQSMVWLMVFHRLATSEGCKHAVRCSICKSHPIIGIRYRCLTCFNFNMCQTCFFSGKKGKTHKITHPMKEYYATSKSNEEMKDLSSPMRKKYSSGRYIKKHHPKGYLPLDMSTEHMDTTISRESTPVSSPPSLHVGYVTSSAASSSQRVNGAGVEGHVGSNSKLPTDGSELDTHENIKHYAQTIDRMELNRNKNNANNKPTDLPFKSTNGSSGSHDPLNSIDSDEHANIIQLSSTLNKYPAPVIQASKSHSVSEPHLDKPSTQASVLKSPIQIVMSLGDHEKTELEAMIKDLEDENRNLQSEYRRLQAERDSSPSPSPGINSPSPTGKKAEMIAEAQQLRQHKSRLESRMKILEEHNKQLEAQLKRLRNLLEQPSDTGSGSDVSFSQSSSLYNSPAHRVAVPYDRQPAAYDRQRVSYDRQQPPYDRQHGSWDRQPAAYDRQPTAYDRQPAAWPPVVSDRQPSYDRQPSSDRHPSESSGGTDQHRSPKLHGSIGELFQSAGHVTKTVGQFVSIVSTDPR